MGQSFGRLLRMFWGSGGLKKMVQFQAPVQVEGTTSKAAHDRKFIKTAPDL
jgi:hypothetical protein